MNTAYAFWRMEFRSYGAEPHLVTHVCYVSVIWSYDESRTTQLHQYPPSSPQSGQKIFQQWEPSQMHIRHKRSRMLCHRLAFVSVHVLHLPSPGLVNGASN
jgi:hypothetical protein